MTRRRSARSSAFVVFVVFVLERRRPLTRAFRATLPAATNPPCRKAQLAGMRALLLTAAVLLLAGCGGVIDRCPNGLDPPGWGSTVPKPHG